MALKFFPCMKLKCVIRGKKEDKVNWENESINGKSSDVSRNV